MILPIVLGLVFLHAKTGLGQDLSISDDSHSKIIKLLKEADSAYWIGQAEGGNFELFNSGLRSLTEAEKALIQLPIEQQEMVRPRITALRRDLLEQAEMAKDTLNGIFPMYYYLLGTDEVAEWVDDPWITGTTRGALTLMNESAAHWKKYSQLDVIFTSKVSRTRGETLLPPEASASEALENELAYLFNQNTRFFNHSALEITTALGADQHAKISNHGLKEENARSLMEAFDVSEILEVRVEEVHIKEPLWFYSLTAKLFSGTPSKVDGKVSAFGFARDNRSKVPWLVAFAVLLLLLGVIAARLKEWDWRLVAMGYVLGPVMGCVVLASLRPSLSAPDELAVLHWWAPASIGLAFAFTPLLAFGAGSRVMKFARFDHFGLAESRALALGMALGLSLLYAFAVLSRHEPVEALVLILPLALALAACSVWMAGLTRGIETAKHSVIFVTVAFLATFILIVSRLFLEDFSTPLIVGLTLLLVIFLIPALLKFSGAGAQWSAAIILGAASITLGMTAELLFLAPLGLAGVGVLFLVRSEKVDLKRPVEDETQPPDHAELPLRSPSEHWPFHPTAPHRILVSHLSPDAQAAGSVSLILVSGDAGTGKTRTIGEAAKSLGLQVLRGSCRSGEPYSFLKDAFGSASEEIFADNETLPNVASSLGSGVLEFLPVPGFVSNLVTSDNSKGTTTGEVAAGAIKLIGQIKSQNNSPVLFHVDDAEHLEADGLSVIKTMIELVLSRQINCSLVVSGRSWNQKFEEEFLAPLKKLGNVTVRSEIISHLNEEDRKGCLAGNGQVETGLLRALLKSGDLPIGYYVEWIRSLWLSGKVTPDSAGSLSLNSKELSPPPRDIYDSVQNLLDKLPEETVRLLEVAALDGMKFDAQVVADVLSIPIPNVLESLEQAERDGIVRDIVDEDRIFAFRSNVYREAVANRISSVDKDQKHPQRYYTTNRLIAESLLNLDEDDDSVIEAATHALDAGGRFKPTTLDLCGKASELAFKRGHWNKSCEYALHVINHDAGNAVDSKSLFSVAATYFRASWSLRRDPAQDDELRGYLDQFCGYLLDPGQSAGHADDETTMLACELSRLLLDHASDLEKGEFKWNPPRNTARRLLENIKDHSECSPAAQTRLYHFLARLDYRESANADTDQKATLLKSASIQIEKAIAAGEPASSDAHDRELAEALNTKGEIMNADSGGDLEKIEKAREAISSSIKIKERLGDQLGLAFSYGALGRSYLYGPMESFNPEIARDAFERDLEISEDIGDIIGLIKMPSFLGQVAIKTKEYKEAHDRFAESLKLALLHRRQLDAAFAVLGQIEAKMLDEDGEQDLQTEIKQFREIWGQLPGDERGALSSRLEKVGNKLPSGVSLTG